jgi:hypothetical protein
MIPTMEERKLLTGSADTDYFKFWPTARKKYQKWSF